MGNVLSREREMRSLFFRETSCSHRGSRTARGARERSHLKEHYTQGREGGGQARGGGGGGTFFSGLSMRRGGTSWEPASERARSVSKRIRLNSRPPSPPPPPLFPSPFFFFLRPILDPAWVEIGPVKRNRAAAVKLFRA